MLGAGERLFDETSDKKPMRLVDATTIGDGLAFLIYEFVAEVERRPTTYAVRSRYIAAAG